MKRASRRHRIPDRKRSDAAMSLKSDAGDQEYRVGPGHPPKEYQFQPGQSGNPKGGTENQGQSHPTLRICSSVRSVER